MIARNAKLNKIVDVDNAWNIQGNIVEDDLMKAAAAWQLVEWDQSEER